MCTMRKKKYSQKKKTETPLCEKKKKTLPAKPRSGSLSPGGFWGILKATLQKDHHILLSERFIFLTRRKKFELEIPAAAATGRFLLSPSLLLLLPFPSAFWPLGNAFGSAQTEISAPLHPIQGCLGPVSVLRAATGHPKEQQCPISRAQFLISKPALPGPSCRAWSRPSVLLSPRLSRKK